MRLGVIGGLGPAATAYFMERVTDMTDALRDQEHLETVVLSLPTIPDRTAFILGESPESPFPAMKAAGQTLISCGARVIAIPCITAHYFHEKLQNELDGAEVLNAPLLTAKYLERQGVRLAGIMATSGTIKSGILQSALETCGIGAAAPSEAGQEAVMSLIYDYIKAGKAPDMELFGAAADELFSAGAERIILGCTELPLIQRTNKLDARFVSVLDVLAAEAIIKCGKRLRAEYAELTDARRDA